MFRLDLLLLILLHSAALLGYLPLAPYLQRLPALAVPAAIAFSLGARQRGLLLRERPALLLAAGCFLYYALQFNRNNVAVPAANLLAVLLAIRLAGEKSTRNIIQNFALALFCLAASTLFDLSPGFVAYLLLLLLIITVSLVLLTFQDNAPAYAPPAKELRSIVLVALLQPVAALPLILLLFFVLPRTQFPLWHGISVTGGDRAGINDTVQPGDRSAIATGKAVVFRAEMPKQPPGALYWRAIVLNSVKGDTWVRQLPPPEKNFIRHGKELVQNIFLEPGRLPYLPALNIPERISGYRTSSHDDRVYPSAGLYGGRRSYQVVSKTDAALATGRISNEFYSRLPEHTPPRLQSLVRQAVAGPANDRQKLAAVEGVFAGLNLSYAASGLPTGADAVDNFLFTGKKGHCELFAIAFATALRTAGLPARLVGGYYGGDYNDIAGYYIVTEERAHVWVEVWLTGSGWTTIDPSRLAINFEEIRQTKQTPLLLRLQLFTDTLAYYWNRLVITYDLESQFAAVNRAGAGLRSLRTGELPLRRAAVIAGWLPLLAGIAWLALRRRQPVEERLLEKFRRVMRNGYGIEITAATGLHEAIRPVNNPLVREFVESYTATVYRDQPFTAAETKHLGRLLRRIARQRH